MAGKSSRQKIALLGAVMVFVLVSGYIYFAGSGSIGALIQGAFLANSPYSLTRTELLNNVPNVETSVAIDPNNPNYMIVGTTPQYFAPEYSTDGEPPGTTTPRRFPPFGAMSIYQSEIIQVRP